VTILAQATNLLLAPGFPCLLKGAGDEYVKYMVKTKMFVPFLF
jgi:hypothetical protein